MFSSKNNVNMIVVFITVVFLTNQINASSERESLEEDQLEAELNQNAMELLDISPISNLAKTENDNEVISGKKPTVSEAAVISATASPSSGSATLFSTRQSITRRPPAGAEATRPLIITTIISEPYVMKSRAARLRREEGSSQAKFVGFCVDLMQMLSDAIGFAYQIKLVNDSKYGSLAEDGTWNGMIGELIRHEADLAVAPLTITKARERVVQFSQPFLTTGIGLLALKPDLQTVKLSLRELSSVYWIYIAAGYAITCTVIFIAHRRNQRNNVGRSRRQEKVRQKGQNSLELRSTNNNEQKPICYRFFNGIFDFALAPLSWPGRGRNGRFRSLAARIAAATWAILTAILVCCIWAKLTSQLTASLQRRSILINSVDELANQGTVKYGLQKGGSTGQFFRASSVPTYQKMWLQMMADGQASFVHSYSDGVKLVRNSSGRYIFLMEASAIAYTNHMPPCNTIKIGDNVNSFGFGVATPIGSQLSHKINLAILDLQERGELRRLENRWFRDTGQCTAPAPTTADPLDFVDLQELLFIFIVGISLALLCLFCECIQRLHKDAKANDKSFCASIGSCLCCCCGKRDELEIGSRDRLSHPTAFREL